MPRRLWRPRYLAVVGISLALLASVTPAGAGGPTITPSPGHNHPEGKVSVRGSGFGPTETVDLSFDSTKVAIARTDENGDFTGRFRVPVDAAPGPHTITALGEESELTATSGFLVITDWTGFQFDARNNRFNPYENVLDPTNVSGLTRLWSYSVTYGVFSSPVVAQGVMYVGAQDNNLYALRASTGHELWAFATNGDIETASAVANGILYVPSNDGRLFALDITTVTLLWAFTAGSDVRSPAVADGVVYVPNVKHLFALDARTGAELWEFPVDTIGSHSSPAVADGIVYVMDTHTLFALDASSGAELWNVPFAGGDSTPVVANGIVYSGSHLGGYDGTVWARDAATGAEVWTFTAPNSGTMTSPAVADGLVYVCADFGSLYALDAATGALRWKFKSGDTHEVMAVASPAVANGLVFFRSDDTVWAMDAATGARLWSTTTGYTNEFSSPVVADGMLFFGSGDDKVYAYGLP